MTDALQNVQGVRLFQSVYVHASAITPDSFQIVEKSVLLVKNVDDNVAKVQQYPVGILISFNLLYRISGLT